MYTCTFLALFFSLDSYPPVYLTHSLGCPIDIKNNVCQKKKKSLLISLLHTLSTLLQICPHLKSSHLNKCQLHSSSCLGQNLWRDSWLLPSSQTSHSIYKEVLQASDDLSPLRHSPSHHSSSQDYYSSPPNLLTPI